MDTFKILSEEELAALSNKERLEYLKQKREFDNAKLVTETANQEPEEASVKIAPASVEKTATANFHQKKSNAGRKAISAAEKKQQIMLTIEAGTKNKLEAVDSKNFKKLLARYIDKNIDTIVKEIEKL